MSHTCPDCYQLCYCGGDIDDCELDGTDEQDACTHCPIGGLDPLPDEDEVEDERPSAAERSGDG